MAELFLDITLVDFGRGGEAGAQRMSGEFLDPPVGRSKSPGYGHLKLPHLMIAVSAAEQQ
ncbi:hypothetical protein ACVMHZ_009862 [Bradyrhizobium liaoningense]